MSRHIVYPLHKQTSESLYWAQFEFELEAEIPVYKLAGTSKIESADFIVSEFNLSKYIRISDRYDQAVGLTPNELSQYHGIDISGDIFREYL